jgi:hypothetical protein
VEYIAKDLRELRDAADAILDGCGELAQSCNDYKSALDELRGDLEGTARRNGSSETVVFPSCLRAGAVALVA